MKRSTLRWEIRQGDALERLRELDDCSVDAICTDPPYGISFMGSEWDGAAIREAAERDRATRKSLGPESASRPGRAEPRTSSAFGDAAHYAGPVRAGIDFQQWCQAWAVECLRVLKPGGHLLAFGGTRTYHRLAAGVEDAGFEIRDCLAWLFGSGFPKSLDVSKAIDRQRDDSQARGDVAEWLRPYIERYGFEEVTAHFGFRDQTMVRARWTTRSQPQTPTVEQWVELKALLSLPDDMDAEVWRLNGRKGQPGENWEKREILGARPGLAGSGFGDVGHGLLTAPDAVVESAPATPEAERWQGFGTALKPAHEPVVVARKPLAGTVAQNVLEYGTGALNVDACRIGMSEEDRGVVDVRSGAGRDETDHIYAPGLGRDEGERFTSHAAGRWPANVILDPESARMLDEQTGELTAGVAGTSSRGFQQGGYVGGANGADWSPDPMGYADSGGASRFFYCAKASRAERNAGLDSFEERAHVVLDTRNGYLSDPRMEREQERRPQKNHHPTVKPIDLMRWLCRLVTPRGGLVLDPFAGSGTTGCAAVLEGFDFVGIEREPEYVRIAEARIGYWFAQPVQLGLDAA